MIMPAEIIKGARALAGEEKLGSTIGAQKIQLVMAPPEIAIIVSVITLNI